MAGHIILVNSVSISKLVYTFSIYRWPSSLIKYVNSILRNFVWTGDFERRKGLAVSWSNCCQPIASGGLGIKNIRCFNMALRVTSLLRIMTISSPTLDFMHSRLLSALISDSRYLSSSIWSGIREVYNYIVQNTRWLVSTNSIRRFWVDNWLGTDISCFRPSSINQDIKIFEQLDDLSAIPDLIQEEVRRHHFVDKDELVWNNILSGKVTGRQIYEALLPNVDGRNLSFLKTALIRPSRFIFSGAFSMASLPATISFSILAFTFAPSVVFVVSIERMWTTSFSRVLLHHLFGRSSLILFMSNYCLKVLSHHFLLIFVSLLSRLNSNICFSMASLKCYILFGVAGICSGFRISHFLYLMRLIPFS